MTTETIRQLTEELHAAKQAEIDRSSKKAEIEQDLNKKRSRLEEISKPNEAWADVAFAKGQLEEQQALKNEISLLEKQLIGLRKQNDYGAEVKALKNRLHDVRSQYAFDLENKFLASAEGKKIVKKLQELAACRIAANNSIQLITGARFDFPDWVASIMEDIPDPDEKQLKQAFETMLVTENEG